MRYDADRSTRRPIGERRRREGEEVGKQDGENERAKEPRGWSNHTSPRRVRWRVSRWVCWVKKETRVEWVHGEIWSNMTSVAETTLSIVISSSTYLRVSWDKDHIYFRSHSSTIITFLIIMVSSLSHWAGEARTDVLSESFPLKAILDQSHLIRTRWTN